MKTMSLTRLPLLILVWFLGISIAYPVSKIWRGPASGGLWSTAANWSPSGVPASGDDVTISNALVSLTTSRTIVSLALTNATIDFGANNVTLTIADVANVRNTTIGNTSGATGTITGTNATARVVIRNAANVSFANATIGVILNIGASATPCGTVAFESGSNFKAVTVFASSILLNGGTFTGAATFTNTGSAASTSTGGCTFNGAFTLTNSGSGTLILANSIGDSYNGTVIVNNTGFGTTHIAYSGTNSFASTVTFSSSSGTSGNLGLSYGGGQSTITGNIIMSSSGGGNISLGGVGSVQHTSGQISVSATTFKGVGLNISNYNGNNAAACSVVVSNTTTVSVKNSLFPMGIILTAGMVSDVSGSTFGTLNQAYSSSITDQMSNGGARYWSGDNTFYGPLTVSFSSSNLYTAYVNGDVYYGLVTINNLAAGRNIYIDSNGKSIFKNGLTLSNASTSWGIISVASLGGNTQITGDITLVSTSINAGDIILGSATGSILQSSGRIMSSATTFTSGALRINNMTLTSLSQQTNFVLGNAARLYVTNVEFPLGATITSGFVCSLTGCKFGTDNSTYTTTIICNSTIVTAPPQNKIISNKFYGLATILHSTFGGLSASDNTFYGSAIFTGLNSTFTSGQTTFFGDLTANTSSNGSMAIASTGINNFYGNIKMSNGGSQFSFAENNDAVANVGTIGSTTTGNISISNSGQGFYLGTRGQTYGKINQYSGNLSIGSFASGTLSINSFVQSSASQTTTITLASTANPSSINNSSFPGGITITAPQPYIDNTFLGSNGCACSSNITANSTLSGAGYTIGGDNKYYGTITLTNSGPSKGTFLLKSDVTNVDLIVNNKGTGTVTLGSGGTNTFLGNITLNNLGTTGSISLGDYGNDGTTVTNLGIIGSSTSGNITINNTSSGNINIGNFYNRVNQYSGKLIVSGFTAGALNLYGLTYSGTQLVNIALTNTASLTVYNCSFPKGVSFTAPKVVQLVHNTFGSSGCGCTNTIIDNGASGTRNWAGRNINYGTTTISSTGAGNIVMAGAQYSFMGDAILSNTGTGSIQIQNLLTDFYGNLEVKGNVLFNSTGDANVMFGGSSDQTIGLIFGATTPTSLTLTNTLTVNKPSGKLILNLPVILNSRLNLTSGIIVTRNSVTPSIVNLLTLGTAAVCTNGSSSSYVSGPMVKQSSVVGASFIYPLGGASRYAPIALTCSTASSSVQVEYFPTGQTQSTTYTNPIKKVSNSEYWAITSNIGNTPSVLVTSLPWSSEISSPSTSVLTIARTTTSVGSTWVSVPSIASGNVFSGFMSASQPFTLPASSASALITLGYTSTFSPFTISTSQINPSFSYILSGAGYTPSTYTGGGSAADLVLYPDFSSSAFTITITNPTCLSCNDIRTLQNSTSQLGIWKQNDVSIGAQYYTGTNASLTLSSDFLDYLFAGMVTTIQNTGLGSLRNAILWANADPDLSTITFNIQGSSKTILQTTSLPSITTPVILDGTSQPGYDKDNTVTIVEVNDASGLGKGILFEGDSKNSEIKGLRFTSFSDYSFWVQVEDVVVNDVVCE